MIVKTNTLIPALTIVRFRQKRVAIPVDPSAMTDYPFQDGVTLSATHDGQVEVADQYGRQYEVTGANFAPGHLYAGAGGALTQDPSVAAATGWLICVGYVVNPTVFIYEPHVPQRL